MEYVIGLDVGTSGAKGVLVDREGKVASSESAEYGMDIPRPGWAEQDPAMWWKASIEVIGRLCKKTGPTLIKAVGLTGQMHSSVFLDKDFQVIRPALLWCDQRTAGEVELITEKVGFDRLIELTANRALTGFTAPKILWLAAREPANHARLRHLLLAKDYLRFMLTGELATDFSDASGTLLFDVAHRRYSDELLDILSIDRSLLAPVFEGPSVTGKVTEAASRLTGLAAGTPVVAGGGDQAAGAVGNGVVAEGPVLITIGTSGVVFAASAKPVIDPRARLHSFCHAAPGMWHTMGVMLSAGGALRWLRETLRQISPRIDYQDLDPLAQKVPPGCDGLLFLPYLTGERTPYFDAGARGVIAGISLSHGIGHLTRAVMEGVAMGVKDSVRLMRESGAEAEVVYLSGGGAKSGLWSGIIASALGLPIKRLSVDEGPAFGAAVLALVGTGNFASVRDAARATLAIRDTIEPDRDAADVYEETYPRFRELYSVTRPLLEPSR